MRTYLNIHKHIDTYLHALISSITSMISVPRHKHLGHFILGIVDMIFFFCYAQNDTKPDP